jgi:hypothetical protein
MSVTARLDQGDGTDLRHVAVDGHLVAARIYFAVRDDRWRTVPLTIDERVLDEFDGGFRLTVRGRTDWPSHPLDFSLEYVAEGTRVEARFTGTARAAFRYNRVGFCLLQPIAPLAGQPLVLHSGGGEVRLSYPEQIEPQYYVDGLPQPLHNTSFEGITATSADGTVTEVRFEGDEFEIEDQRNWSDASNKAYGTPLRLGFPFDAAAGQRFAQSVVISAQPGAAAASSDADAVSVGEVIGTLPPVGLFSPGEPVGVWRPEAGFPDLNRTRPPVGDLVGTRALGVGINGSVHADDRWSIAETAWIHGTIARQIRSLYPGLALRLRPLDFDSPAGQWMAEDGVFRDIPQAPSAHPMRGSDFAAAWVVASLGSLAGVPLECVDYFDEREAAAPAGRLLAWLGARSGRTLRSVTAPAGIAALAIDDELVLANPDSRPRRVLVAGRPVDLGPDAVIVLRPSAASVGIEELA